MAMKRRASRPITPELAAHIRYLRNEQKLYQHQIAALVDVNQGRVNDVLKGRRFPDVPSAQGSFPF